MLHEPYLQTPAKILESGMIDDLFMLKHHSKIQDCIAHYENGVYIIELGDSMELIVCFADFFNPVGDFYTTNIKSLANKQWLSLIYGEMRIIKFVTALSGGAYYTKEYCNKDTELTQLYLIGGDDIKLNESMLIEKDTIFTTMHNAEQDLLLFRYNHSTSLLEDINYYQGEKYSFEYINRKSKIVEFKDKLRVIMRNAEAISRLQSRLQNPL